MCNYKCDIDLLVLQLSHQTGASHARCEGALEIDPTLPLAFPETPSP